MKKTRTLGPKWGIALAGTVLLATSTVAMAGAIDGASVKTKTVHGTIVTDTGEFPITLNYNIRAMSECHQWGEAASWKHPADTRRIEYNTYIEVDREMCYPTPFGQSCDPDFKHTYHVSSWGKSEPFKAFKGELHHTSCMEAAQEIANARAETGKSWEKALSEAKKLDRKDLAKQLQNTSMVKIP